MKLPPEEKIYEAYSAIADRRIEMHEDHALVASSDRSRTYTVRWEDMTYASDDNATYWQGYPGYPVLAVLLLKGILEYDEKAVMKMHDIPWKALNDRHKRKYAEALKEALETVRSSGETTEDVERLAEKNNDRLRKLELVIRRKITKK
jgi:hypothetical protein